jgi:hypothetical protein
MTGKFVQTTLDESEYREFRKAAERVRNALREAAREAIDRWTEEVSGSSLEDPIFRLKPVSYRDRTR